MTILKELQDWVNSAIIQDAELKAQELPLEEAAQSGAMALFSERYPPKVRVVDIEVIRYLFRNVVSGSIGWLVEGNLWWNSCSTNRRTPCIQDFI